MAFWYFTDELCTYDWVIAAGFIWFSAAMYLVCSGIDHANEHLAAIRGQNHEMIEQVQRIAAHAERSNGHLHTIALHLETRELPPLAMSASAPNSRPTAARLWTKGYVAAAGLEFACIIEDAGVSGATPLGSPRSATCAARACPCTRSPPT